MYVIFCQQHEHVIVVLVFVILQIKYVDVACVNKYFGWYSDIGEPFLIPLQLPDFLTGFYNKYGHPVIMTEYGAETIPGMHNVSSYLNYFPIMY